MLIEYPLPLPPFDLVEVDTGTVNLYDSAQGYLDFHVIRPNLLKWIDNEFMEIAVCPYCHSHFDIDTYRDKDDNEFPHTGQVWACPKCAHWQVYWWIEMPSDPMTGAEETCEYYILSKVRTFDGEIPRGVDSEIAQGLARNPGLWHRLTPRRFEVLVASIFRANYKHSEVLHVGRPDDGGVDVLFVDSGNRQWLIQAKRRESVRAVEGVTTLRNLLGTMFLEDALHGIVASTADHFSHRARGAAKKAAKRGLVIRLLDKGKLHRMIGPILPRGAEKEVVDVILEEVKKD